MKVTFSRVDHLLFTPSVLERNFYIREAVVKGGARHVLVNQLLCQKTVGGWGKDLRVEISKLELSSKCLSKGMDYVRMRPMTT